MLKKPLQPIDKIAIAFIFIFSLVMGGLVWAGKACGTECFLRTGPHIQHFSWQDKEVGAGDTAFTLTFDRPMDPASVEAHLTITPLLAGKFSWAGRRLAYTLSSPAPYGETYQVKLQDAQERFRGTNQLGAVMEPFSGQFSSRDRAFAYIGIEGEEQGRLVLYNLTQKRKAILTPPGLAVMDFKFYPQGDRVLFSAADRNLGVDGIRELQLYAASTEVEAGSPLHSPEQVELVLDNKDYQNNQFDLSADGETIVVQRVNRKNPADFDLWAIKPNEEPERLKVEGGEFLIAPDSKSLAVARGEGIGILPLTPAAEPLDFLPKFGQLLSFSKDGTAAALVDFNSNDAKLRYLRSLFYVNNQGVQKKLLTTDGSILDCQFEPQGKNLYCLLTQLLPGEAYREQPYFAKIDLKTAKVFPLAALPEYHDTRLSLSPDGLAILFDQPMTSDHLVNNDPLTTNSGETIVNSHLWLLIPPTAPSAQSSQPQLESLPFSGLRPQWLP
jgi:dipeptidyl aminopeptidase/acylaminoacyl peptidase